MTNKNKIINQAQKFIQKGQWDKAIKELQKLVAEDPSDVRTLLKLGDVYAKKGDRDQATKVYKQVAASYGEQGFFLKAVAVYKQILKHDPKHLEVTLKLAELYEHLGLTSEAMVQYQIAAQMHDEAGNVRETLDVLKRMVELDGDNVASRIKLAESFSRENRVQEAIEQFLRASEILKRHNRIEDYIKVTERLVYHDPNRLDVIKELAKLYLERNDTKRALAKLQLCFKAAPRDIETLTLLSGAFRELGQVQKTVFVLRELARIHQENGEVAESRSVAQKILEIDPNDADARAALGYPTAPGSRAGTFAGALNGAQMFGSTGVMPGFGGATAVQPAVFGQAPVPYPGPAMNPAQSFGVTTGGMAAHPAPAGFGSTTGPQAAYGAPGGFGAGTGPQPAHGGFAGAAGHVAGYPPGPAAGYHPQQMGAPGFGPGSGPMPAAQAYGGAPAAGYGPANPAGFGVATNLGVAIPAPNATPRRRGIQDPSEPAEPRVPSKSTSSGAAKPENPQIAKILTETDVYIKYGLRDKAVEHLRKVFEIDADSVAAYGKLRDIYSSAGDLARAAEMVGNIMQIHARRGDQEALAAARAELAGFAPNHPLLSGVPVAGDIAGAVTDAEGLDSIDITEASDNYDARDLRAAAAQRGVTIDQLDEEPPAEADAVDAWLQQDPGFDELAEGADQETAATFAGEETAGELDPDIPPESGIGAAEVVYGFSHEISSVSVAPDDIVESVESEQEVEAYAEEEHATGQFEQPSADEASFPSEGHDADAYGAPGLDPFASVLQTAVPEPHADLEMPDPHRAAAEAHRDLEAPDPYGGLGLPTEEEANELPEAASGIVMLEATPFEDGALAGSAEFEEAEPDFEAAEETAGEAVAAPHAGPPSDAAEGLDAVPWYEAADPEEASLGATPLEFQSPVVEAPRPEGALSPEETQKIEDELDEAEFLAGEGLREEALEAIASVLSRVTGHPRAVALRALIESGALGGEADDEEEDSDEAGPADEAAPALAAGDTGQPQDAESFGDVSDDELADAFDLGGDGGDGSNPEDHYDEAMAYKELNRLDDAIAHFRLAANSPSRAIPALEMIGHCLVAKGDYEGAIQSFYAAFERGVEGPAAINLKFEIAATYEAAGDAEQAVSWFRSCYADDPDHRDVRGRLAALGVDPSEAETPSPHMNGVSAPSEQPEQQERAVSKKNKISYL